ncbi:universal stress protein [Desulfobacterales bacterium HSG2]|nr:universal stress protein [Desulfobacterales bacterium HSG2]
MFKKVLLALSPNKTCQRAADMAFALAGQNNAELHIFHACGMKSDGWGGIEHFASSGKVEETKEEINNFCKEKLGKFDVKDYAIEVTPGLAHSEILRFARKKAVDLIVMGPHVPETGQMKKWGTAGSSLEKVSQRARCPVMVVSEQVPRIWSAETVGDRKDFRILVVDDEQVLRDSLREWLREEGYSVDTAESGQEALEKLAAGPYQMMLTDIKMPEMDGVGLLKRANERFPDLTVVMMTAYATVETAIEAMKIGALDYLLKPFDPEAMVSKVSEVYQAFETARSVKVTFSDIVLATDFSDQAHHAFDFASRMTQYHEAKLHIFHAIPVGHDDTLMLNQAEIEKSIRDATEKMEGKYGSELEGVAEYSVESWEGMPYVEILKFARWNNADLIIMAHHSRESDPEKALLGSNVVRVALSATCPTVSINRRIIAS